MKISFDNALLWLIPYLYLVSVFYYWGYWGTFDIDAFNYYEVADLVKGVTSPLGTTLLWVGGFGFVMFLWEKAIEILEKRGFGVLLTVSIIVLVVVIAAFILMIQQAKSAFIQGVDEFWHYSTYIVVAALMITRFLDKNIPEKALSGSLRRTILLFFVMLPCQAHIGGRTKSLYITAGAEFDYVVSDSLAIPKSIYKFLGKAGDYYFLSTLNNQKHFIVSTDKLSPLAFEHYSRRDDASRVRFNATKGLLISDSLKNNKIKLSAPTK